MIRTISSVRILPLMSLTMQEQRQLLLRLFLLLPLTLTVTIVNSQEVLFEGDGAKKLTEAIASGREAPAKSRIDTEQIIYPLLKPWAKAVGIMEQNAKALEFADKVEKERRESLLNPSRSIFDFLKPRRKSEEPSTTPKPMLERLLLDPFLKPLKNEFDWLAKDLQLLGSQTSATTAAPPRKNDLFANLFTAPAPKTVSKNPISIKLVTKNTTAIPRIEPSTLATITTTTPLAPLLTLLESLGHNQKRREEMGFGRDQTLNVLGMPIGRRDGLSLTPLKGLSLGNEDMFGPVAVNDKYNVNWGFFNDLSKMFSKTPQQLAIGTPIAPISSSG